MLLCVRFFRVLNFALLVVHSFVHSFNNSFADGFILFINLFVQK